MVKSWFLGKSLIFSLVLGYASSAQGMNISDLEAQDHFTGNYRILVTRPVYAPYSDENRTEWIAAVSEPFFRYKISALPHTYIYTQIHISDVLRNYRDFSRRVSKQAYIDAARELGATHVFYQEYEPQGRNSVRFSTELINVATNAVATGASEVFDISNLEQGLFKILEPVAREIYYDAKDLPLYSETFLGDNQRVLQNLGNALIEENSFSAPTAENIFNSVDRLANQNPQLPVARYTAAKIASRAGKHPQAIAHQSALISRSTGHNLLYLTLARFHRRAENYSDALNAIKQVENVEGLKIQATMERANILEAMDNFSAAKAMYEIVLQSGESKAEIFFRLALVSIHLRQPDQARNFIQRSEQQNMMLNQNQHYRLAEAYAEQGNMDDSALNHLKKSLSLQQSNPDAWSLKAQIYLRQNRQSDAARCYVSLFHIDNNRYRNKLRTAGELYEKTGSSEDAKDAYSLFLARRFHDPVVSLRLASIYFNENNCSQATQLLEGIDTLAAIRGEATKIMDHCLGKDRGRRAVVPGATLGARRLSPFRVVLVITTGVAAAGSFTGGFLADRSLEDLGDKYRDANYQSEVVDLREQINTRKQLRNIFYIASGASLGLFTINIAIPSRN